tara:strand:+ start:307 stop:555 length:249 start_codon:yes stop_codon:yes gene_type:complete
MQNIAPIIGAGISLGGIIFHIGKHSEKLNLLNFKVDALEEKKKYDDDLMHHIHSKLLVSEERLKNIEEDVKEIKLNILEKKK